MAVKCLQCGKPFEDGMLVYDSPSFGYFVPSYAMFCSRDCCGKWYAGNAEEYRQKRRAWFEKVEARE